MTQFQGHPDDKLSKPPAQILNEVGIQILAIDVSKNRDENFMAEEIRRLYSLRDHTDSEASRAFDHGWPVQQAHESELRDIDKRIRELKETSIKEQTLRLAADYFRQSAELGDPEGMWNLGWRYCLGEGVERSKYEAAHWWRRAAHFGHTSADEMLKRL